ncbi:MAG: hypothetical protein WCP14_00490 [bacterium]
MSKIKVNKENIIRMSTGSLKYLQYFSAILFVIVMVYLSYYVLVPRADVASQSQGIVENNKLNMNFNTKILNETSQSQNIQAAEPGSTRNPFSPM